MNKRSAAALIIPALLLEMADGIEPAPLVPRRACPNCTRGKLSGTNRLVYCQRCSFTVKP